MLDYIAKASQRERPSSSAILARKNDKCVSHNPRLAHSKPQRTREVTGEKRLTIQQFAEQYHVKVRRDSCGEEIIPGKPRNAKRQEDRRHIFQHSDDGKLFGVYVHFNSGRAFGFALRRLLAAGFTPAQIGDTEGTMLFNPSDVDEAKAAIQEAGIRISRPASPEQLARLARTAFRPQPEASSGA
jgi:hypothetical protein